MEKKNNRKILEYFTCENKEHWLREIQKSDWGAGQYLYSLLKENKLKARTCRRNNAGFDAGRRRQARLVLYACAA